MRTTDLLQELMTEVNKRAFTHRLEGSIFISRGYREEGEKYLQRSDYENAFVCKVINRILELGEDLHQEETGFVLLKKDYDVYRQEDIAETLGTVKFLQDALASEKIDSESLEIISGFLQRELDFLAWLDR